MCHGVVLQYGWVYYNLGSCADNRKRGAELAHLGGDGRVGCKAFWWLLKRRMVFWVLFMVLRCYGAELGLTVSW